MKISRLKFFYNSKGLRKADLDILSLLFNVSSHLVLPFLFLTVC